jgi:hypothetical protein
MMRLLNHERKEHGRYPWNATYPLFMHCMSGMCCFMGIGHDIGIDMAFILSHDGFCRLAISVESVV